MRVQGSVHHLGHQREQLIGVGHRPEGQPSRRRGNRGARPPLQAQPFDEQPRAGPRRGRHPVLGGLPGGPRLAPVRVHEAEVVRGLGSFRDHLGHGGAQQTCRDVHGFRAAGVVEVEEVQGVRVLVAGPGPPPGPGRQAAVAGGDPQPLRPPVAVAQVGRQFLIELVREPVEQVKFVRPADRPDGQVIVMRGQGVSLCGGAPPAPGSGLASPGGGRERGGSGVHGIALLSSAGPAGAAPPGTRG